MLESSLELKIQGRTARVGIIGLGYVGLPLAVEAAKAGFSVLGVDTDAVRAAGVNRGESHIADVHTQVVRRLVESERLAAAASYDALRGADVLIICVPTPLTKSKEPDLSYVVAAAKGCVPVLRRDCLVVLESTTYPGTTVEVVKPALEASGLRAGSDFHLAFSPERIDPGNKTHAFRDIPKIVGGLTPACTRAVQTFYEQIVKRVVVVSSPTVAEMAKVYENVFRNVNIALVNELTLLCNRMGVDVWEVIDAAATKPYGFMPFYPGPGVGGHCIPVDPYYLSAKAREYDFHARFIELAATVNDSMPYYVLSRVTGALGARGKTLRGARIMVLSPSLKIIQLLEKPGAVVTYHDPHVPSITLTSPGETIYSVPLTDETLSKVDCVILATDHSDIDYQRLLDKAPLIIDTRNRLRGNTNSHVVRL
ncbi:MAG: nucleotide sugar dehydrogenase [Bacillati bacterium ANGP1]|uniref:Nucleotide sugar dehydrogenase n=1 Tax=Candidatus Segetimicrobium genomatis TaxID=2569760 RepID=A0A537JHC2_9BACT|nr:MAG: nucleotide sugar dehydrogenase [Terrabacteria group bacterium ANGP1]